MNRIIAISRTIALVAAVCAGCAPTLPATRSEPPRGEWKVSAPATSPTRPWKGIVAGQTLRQEVDQRFSAGEPCGTTVCYQIDRIQARIGYAPDGKVISTELPAAVEMDESKLIAKFGAPDRTHVSAPQVKELEYDGAGLTVLTDVNEGKTTRVRLKPASGVERTTSRAQFDELVPIRPPLADLEARRTMMASALGQNVHDVSAAEQQLAEDAYRSIAEQGIPIRAANLQEYVRGLISRLSSVTPRCGAEWHVYVIEGSVPQAMNLGGGYVLVTQGFIEQLDTEGQFAYIIAHEMAHQLRGDLSAERSRQSISSLIVVAGAVAAGVFGGELAARTAMSVGSVAAQVGMTPFSREQEAEADLIALHILEAAGYDPRQAVPVMDRLAAFRDKYGHPVSILATHPSPEARMAQVQDWLSARDAVDYSHSLVTTLEFIEIRSRYHTNRW